MKIDNSGDLDNSFQVSVIVPSYNRANTVGATIESIISQKCSFQYEIVIGDDCSTDNAKEVLMFYYQKYPQIIKLIFHEENIGLAANWATCVKACRGKYIANCDNDDYWHNTNKLQLQVDFMESHTEYGVVHTNYRNNDRALKRIDEVDISKDVYDDNLQNLIFSGRFRCCNATIMYRKSVLLKYVPLDDYIKYRFTLQDWNTWLILAAYTKFYCLPISTATFGIETESITRPKDVDKLQNRLINEKKMYEYLCNMFPNSLFFNSLAYDSFINQRLLNLAYKNKNYKIAKKYSDLLRACNVKSLKILCASNIISFNFLIFFKFVKKSLKCWI